MLNNRFAEENEIFEITKPFKGENKGCGPVVYAREGNVRVIDDEGHILEIGQTGTGKSCFGSINYAYSVIENGESVVIVDPKGEVSDCTIEDFKAAGYKVYYLDFRNPYASQSYNPLAYAYYLYHSGDNANIDTALKLVSEFAHSLYWGKTSTKAMDPFWPSCACCSCEGTILYLMDTVTSVKELTLTNVIKKLEEFTRHSVPKYSGYNRGNDDFANQIRAQLSPACCDLIMNKLSTLFNANDSVARDVLSVAKEPIMDFIRTKGQYKIFENNGIKIQSITGEEKFVFFIVIPDESPVFNMATGILLSQLTVHLVNQAREFPGGRLPIRVNIIVEELGNIGSAFPNLPHLMTAGRSRNLRLCLILQSLKQLSQVFDANNAEIIRSNAGLVIIYRTNDVETMRLYSELCGQCEKETPYGIRIENLIDPTAIASLKTGQALIIYNNDQKFVANLPLYTNVHKQLAG